MNICPKGTHLSGRRLPCFYSLFLKEPCPRKFQKEPDSCFDPAPLGKTLTLPRSRGCRKSYPFLLPSLCDAQQPSPYLHLSSALLKVSSLASSSQCSNQRAGAQQNEICSLPEKWLSRLSSTSTSLGHCAKLSVPKTFKIWESSEFWQTA